MDIVKIQALIAQGKLIDLSSTDPANVYLQLGVYQAPNSRKSSGDPNAYAPYAISLQDLLAYNQIQDEGTDLLQRRTVNFIGAGVAASDDPINGVTNVVIPGSNPVGAGLYTQTANSTPITNTTSELTLLDGGVGSLTVPGNGFAVGDSFQANLSGHINSKNNDKLQIRVKTATGVLLADTGQVTMPSCTNQHWDLKLNFTIRTLGVAGVASIASTVMFTYTKNASNAFEGENISIINNTTFDTTINNTLEITAQWNAADPLNSIYTELFTLFKTY
jgi:hypothetical protein